MAGKGKNGKPGATAAPAPAPAAAAAAPGAAPPPGDKPEEKTEEKKKSEQPKDEVGTRKGCRRYKWEFKDSNREFWVMGYAEVKLISLVSGPISLGRAWGVGECPKTGRGRRSGLPEASSSPSPLPWLKGHVSRQGCLIGSLIMFTGTTVHPLLTLIITMELSIFTFFIIIYTFAIQRYMPFILWPISVSEGQWGVPEPGMRSRVYLGTWKVTEQRDMPHLPYLCSGHGLRPSSGARAAAA